MGGVNPGDRIPKRDFSGFKIVLLRFFSVCQTCFPLGEFRAKIRQTWLVQPIKLIACFTYTYMYKKNYIVFFFQELYLMLISYYHHNDKESINSVVLINELIKYI